MDLKMNFETQCGESPVAPTYLWGAENGQGRTPVKFDNGSDKIPVGRRPLTRRGLGCIVFLV